MKMSYKYKMYSLIAVVLVLALLFFFWLYPMMNAKNQVLADEARAKNKEYTDVLAEQQSYELGKKDLQTLKNKQVQPEELFSQDTKLVKEIEALEQLAQRLGLKFSLQVSGSAKNAPKLTKATAQLNSVPYTMNVEGEFDKVIQFTQSLEHMQFVTQAKVVNVIALSLSQVRLTMNAEFYIKP
jgi:Tfp pilus assembly protein PilO